MTSEGHSYAWFQRALKSRNVIAADAAAREIGQLTLSDALLLVGLYAEKDSARFERAAVRWHGRLELETTDLGLVESQLALAALAALAGPEKASAARVLAELLSRLRLR